MVPADNMAPKPTGTKKHPACAQNPSAKAKAAEEAPGSDGEVLAPKRGKKVALKHSKKKVLLLEESSDEGAAERKGNMDGEDSVAMA